MAKGKDAVLDLTPQQERERFGEAFPSVVSDVVDGRIDVSRPREASGQSEETKKYNQRKYNDLRRQRDGGGVPSATVISMLPFDLHLNSTLQGHQIVVAAQDYKSPTIFPITPTLDSRIQPVDGDDYPILWPPLVQAREFEFQYFDYGGVMIWKGDLSKVDLEGYKAQNPEFARNYEEAYTRMLKWAREMVARANDDWNTPNKVGARNITVVHRRCAQILHEATGQQMPPWIDATPGQYGKGELCKNCRNIPAGDAISCEKCGYVLDPGKAYEEGLIDVENDALRRLDRPELEKLGISELIEETHGERKERNRKDADRLRAERAKK